MKSISDNKQETQNVFLRPKSILLFFNFNEILRNINSF